MPEKLKIIPLGGLSEIGKNMTVVEYGKDMIVIDCGLAFPDDEMLGVDLVIPDISYLKKNKSKLMGVFLTHGHEDHIGALPYFLKEISVPVYCTRLTAGIVGTRLLEHRLLDSVTIHRKEAGDTVKLGCFLVEFIRVNHSVADAVAFAITTPVGVIVFSGDFKIDPTPVSSEMIDLARFGELGKAGVLAYFGDSTNVERPGYAMSEKNVGESLDAQFKGCDQRILIATFASNVHRIQQIIDAAVRYRRHVAVSGRSMENILNVAAELGYLSIPKGVLVELAHINRYPKSKMVIITTGSQGEPMSALSRMAFSEHKQVEIGRKDKIIIAASPIPGNEKPVYRLINELFKKGAEVVYERFAEVHVSGHACREELKTMLALLKPKYFMPVHGEYRHLVTHAELAKSVGVAPKNIFIGDIGRVFEITKTEARLGGTVQAGKVLVDGLVVGDVGSTVLRDRKHLSEEGLLLVAITLDSDSGMLLAGPELMSRGFIYAKDAESLMEELRSTAKKTVLICREKGISDWATIKSEVKDNLAGMLFRKTKRRPMILTVIMEV